MTHLILIQPDQSFSYQQISIPAKQVQLDFLLNDRLPDYIKTDDLFRNADVNYAAVVWQDWVIAHPMESANRPVSSSRLTRRQLDVLTSFSEGMTGKQIANQLNISQRSVSLHVAALKQNLQANTIAECVQKAARLGILKPGGR